MSMRGLTNMVDSLFGILLVHMYEESIDQILLNTLHGPMHYKIGVTCVYTGYVFYTLL